MPIAWGKIKDKGYQKKSQFNISKNCKMEKKNIQIPRGTAGKTLIAEVSHLVGL